MAIVAPAQAAGPVVRTFLFTGSEQVYNVPAAATAVHVTLVGAPGAPGGDGSGMTPGHGGAGGFGDVVDADVPVTPGGVLYVEVGAPGVTPTGFGGAGAGMTGTTGARGGNGGGATDVRSCAMMAAFCPTGSTLSSRLVVAGGGGGGGGAQAGSDGGAGGNPFSQGQPHGGTAPAGGGAGSATTPCAPNGGVNNGADGVFGFGGNGGFATTNYAGGGGGGGGYCGGGGGGAKDNSWAAGGGGGSDFLTSNTVDIPSFPDNTGIPKATITYTDLTAPGISIKAPGSGESYSQGASILADYTCTDDQGGAGVASCSGPVATGAPIDTSTPGLHQFTVATSDNAHNSITRTVDYTVVATAATISNVSQTARRWREGNNLPTVARAKPPVGTTFKVTLDRPATVAFSFTQSRAGRRVGRKCVRPTKRNRSKRRCHRTVVAGTLTFPGRAGVNTVRFQGRLGKRKRLKPGRYTLVITATTPQGLKSKAPALKFTIVP